MPLPAADVGDNQVAIGILGRVLGDKTCQQIVRTACGIRNNQVDVVGGLIAFRAADSAEAAGAFEAAAGEELDAVPLHAASDTVITVARRNANNFFISLPLSSTIFKTETLFILSFRL